MISVVCAGLFDAIENAIMIAAMKDFNNNPSRNNLKSSDVIGWGFFATVKWYIFGIYAFSVGIILFTCNVLYYKCCKKSHTSTEMRVVSTEN